MKRMIVLILTVCLLAGCSLARAGKAGPDELVGFFVTVTRENPDGTTTELWDAEAAGVGSGGDYALAGHKLYARRTDGAVPAYEFPAGCGMSCFVYDTFVDGEASSRTLTASPEIDVADVRYYTGETSRYELEGVLYATAGTRAVIHMNPVYQTPEGEVYAHGSKPVGYQVDGGAGFSVFQSQDYAANKGYTTYQDSKVTMTVEYVTLPECYVILEMSEGNELLRQSEYTPGELPEVYTPGADAAYLILEARTGEDTTRTAYSPGDESMDTYRPGEYGFCIKGCTAIDWEGV